MSTDVLVADEGPIRTIRMNRPEKKNALTAAMYDAMARALESVNADKAIYTGSARLWQGDTAVSADTITIDEKTGDLYGHGNVRSTQIMQQTDAQRGVVARGQGLRHDGHDTGGRGWLWA